MNEHDYDVIFDILLRRSSTCSLLVNPAGKIIRFNDAYTRMIGYTDEEIRNKDFTVYINDGAYDREVAFIEQLLNGEMSDIKFRSSRLTKDKRVLQVEVTAILFRDRNDQPEFVLKRIEDITDRIQSEDISKNQHFYLQTILEEIPLMIYFKDRESRFISNSRDHIRFLGFESFDEVNGKTDADFFSPEHARQTREDEQYIMASGRTLSMEESMPLKDGGTFWGQTIKAVLRDVNGEVIGTYGITRDITEIKNAQENLNRMNQLLSDKNTQLEETIAELGRTQNRLIFSEKMAALGSLIGGIAHEINTPLGAIKASSGNINDVMEKISVDLPWMLNNASKEEIEWLFRLFKETDSREATVLSREERQKKRALTSLLENQGIRNAAQVADTVVLLGMNLADAELLNFLRFPNAQRLLSIIKVLFSLQRNATNIHTSVEKASHVVWALKSYIHKNHSGSMEAANLKDMLDSVLTLTANLIKHSKTEVRIDLQANPMIFCRQDELCQVWTNLITNAVQAMGENGSLHISVYQPNESSVQISFRDTGCGMDEATASHVFEPYFTTKETGVGTGMGLDLSRQIVEHHAGKIWFDTTAGAGSTFHVLLPLENTGTV